MANLLPRANGHVATPHHTWAIGAGVIICTCGQQLVVGRDYDDERVLVHTGRYPETGQ